MAEVFDLSYRNDPDFGDIQEKVTQKLTEAITGENINTFVTWLIGRVKVKPIEFYVDKVRELIFLEDRNDSSVFFQVVWVGVRSYFKDTDLSEMAVRINHVIYPHRVPFRDEIIEIACALIMERALEALKKHKGILVYDHPTKDNTFKIEIKNETTNSLF